MRLGLGPGAARPILAAPGEAQYPLFAAFSKAADGRFCRWVYVGCSLCLSPLGGAIFSGSDTRSVYGRIDLTVCAITTKR